MDRLLLILAFCILSNPIFSQEEKSPIKILFVGNSFTFFWNMPQLVSAMAESQGVSINSYQSTVSGSSLEQHWKGEKGSITRKKIDENKKPIFPTTIFKNNNGRLFRYNSSIFEYIIYNSNLNVFSLNEYFSFSIAS